MRGGRVRTLCLGVLAFAAAIVGVGDPTSPLRHASAQPSPPPDILSFYATAVSVTESPPRMSTLSVLCHTMLPSRVSNQSDIYSFIGGRDKKVLLAARSTQELTNLGEAISLKDLVSGHTKGPGAVQWAYVFDRNRDGKIDYIAFPEGFSPVEPKDFPSDFPKQLGNFTPQQAQYLRSILKVVFYHYADDAFRGEITAVVVDALDRESDYLVAGGQLVRSSRFDGVLDECWFFSGEIGRKSGDCERSGEGYRTRSFTVTAIGPNDMASFSKFLSVLNEAAGACGLTAESFR